MKMSQHNVSAENSVCPETVKSEERTHTFHNNLNYLIKDFDLIPAAQIRNLLHFRAPFSLERVKTSVIHHVKRFVLLF